MCAAVAVRTPWQFGDRSTRTSANNNGVVLPKVEVVHPSKKLGDINGLNLQGGACSSTASSAPRHSSAPRPSGPATVIHSPQPSGGSPTFLPHIPDGVVVEVAKDRTKVHLPIFGNARVSSRIENRLSSQMEAGRNERPTVTQLEKSIRDKLSTSYLTVKSVFQSYDAEGRGKVSRDQLSRVLSQCLATNVSLSQFNRLMRSLGLDNKDHVTFDEFYQLLNTKEEPGTEYPSWFFQDGISEPLTGSKVHTYLKQEASKDADKLLISLGLLGEEKIIKPEFRDAVKRIGYDLSDREFGKLWKKYDDSGTGVVETCKLLDKLSQKQKVSEKTKKEKPRERQIGIEKWLTKKFRTAFRDMQHAFREVESDDGTVSRDHFLRVLGEFGLMLKSGQLDTFLGRCNLQTGTKIDYKSFLRMFQSRGENGMGGSILRNPAHKYHRVDSVASCVSTVSDIEGVLMDLFHADFLKLLTKFQKIDQTGKGIVSLVEFRACLESFFGGEISNSAFNDLLKDLRKENGKIDYQSFLSKFDCDDSKTIFDSVSSLGDAGDRNYFARSLASSSLSSAYSRQSVLSPTEPVSGNRGVAQVSAEIKAKVNGDFQLVADVFHELDEKNTKRMNAVVLHKLLVKLGVSVTSQESETLYKHILTDQNGTLEFSQFVRHFGFSIKSAVYPNAKRNPPSRGDQDFRMLSHRFNSSKELVEDLVKNVVEQQPEMVTQQFLDIDKTQTGTVSEEDFKRILLSMCGDLTLQEQKMLVARYGVNGISGVSWRKFMAKMCPPKVLRRSTDVIVHHEGEDE